MKTKEEIKQWLLENCVDEYGNLELSNLDFSDFEGNIILNGLLVKKNLYQDCQEVNGNISQKFQISGGDINQDFQKVGKNLYQRFQMINENVFKDEVKELKKHLKTKKKC